jgi:hypothetical protein
VGALRQGFLREFGCHAVLAQQDAKGWFWLG